MAEKLRTSTNPYLIQHQDNPVDWYPWGEEALCKAQKENKPIFLSIGYSACHWCHVMEKESFQDPKVADILNRLFVSIKVDREERPDIDAIYLQAVILMTGSAGWPTSVWLTPDLKPFYGGTYFPPAPKHGTPSFTQVLLSIASAWRDQKDKVAESADELIEAIKRLSQIPSAPSLDDKWVERAVASCKERFDEASGGFGEAPKFPLAMTLRFLLLQDQKLLPMVEKSAKHMAKGGIFDQIGGGFHRYCVDADWQIPHFEKMLYDNALLLGLYADLAAYTGNPLYTRVVEQTAGWLKREMQLEHGGFACSLDADSEGKEGAYYVWTPAQLREILSPDEYLAFKTFYGVTLSGNFEDGKTVLTQELSLKELAAKQKWSLEKAQEVLHSARHKALAARSSRVAPFRDDKAVAAWNAQTVSALCRAARQLDLEIARELALEGGAFLVTYFSAPQKNGGWARLVCQGVSQGQAMSEDIASLVLAYYDLYELTLEDSYSEYAQKAFEVLLSDFWDPKTKTTAMTALKTTDVPLRPYSFDDNSTPSAHSLLLECCRRHHRLTGSERSQHIWQQALNQIASIAQRAPTGMGFALQSAVLNQRPALELILAGKPEETREFLNALAGKFLPELLVARADTPALASELKAYKEPGKAYLCFDKACQAPVTSVQELRGLLDKIKR